MCIWSLNPDVFVFSRGICCACIWVLDIDVSVLARRTFMYFYLFVGPWYGWKWMWWRSLVSRCAHKLLHHSHTSQLKLPKQLQIRKWKIQIQQTSHYNHLKVPTSYSTIPTHHNLNIQNTYKLENTNTKKRDHRIWMYHRTSTIILVLEIFLDHRSSRTVDQKL